MVGSLEMKAMAQQAIRKATPLIAPEIYWLHEPPPVEEQFSFLKAMKPAMDFICNELKCSSVPRVVQAGFIDYMKPRWDVFSDPRYQGKKSTYPVWFLHMLAYFIQYRLPSYSFRPEDGSKCELNQKMEAIRLRGMDNRP
jgi:hypothetical protein